MSTSLFVIHNDLYWLCTQMIASDDTTLVLNNRRLCWYWLRYRIRNPVHIYVRLLSSRGCVFLGGEGYRKYNSIFVERIPREGHRNHTHCVDRDGETDTIAWRTTGSSYGDVRHLAGTHREKQHLWPSWQARPSALWYSRGRSHSSWVHRTVVQNTYHEQVRPSGLG